MVLDTQSVHAASGVPASTTGRDPAKKVPGRKRGLAVDVLGLVIAVIVLATNTHDNAADIALLDQVAEHTGGTVRKALVDQGFKRAVVAHGTALGIDVEIVERNPQDRGSSRSRSGGGSSRPTGSSCCPDAWSATTSTAPPPSPASTGR